MGDCLPLKRQSLLPLPYLASTTARWARWFVRETWLHDEPTNSNELYTEVLVIRHGIVQPCICALSFLSLIHRPGGSASLDVRDLTLVNLPSPGQWQSGSSLLESSLSGMMYGFSFDR
jgi:hypothetical protein